MQTAATPSKKMPTSRSLRQMVSIFVIEFRYHVGASSNLDTMPCPSAVHLGWIQGQSVRFGKERFGRLGGWRGVGFFRFRL
jgi:hypothetical protein